jgi:serine/threonine protein kinase
MCSKDVEAAYELCPRCRKLVERESEKSKQPKGLDDTIPVGTVVAEDYEVVRLVGKGGAGSVYEAKQRSLNDMRVALKVLHRDLNRDQRAINLLKKEVIIARKLAHENIIKVFSLEKVRDRHFVVMEYVGGESLLSVLRRSGKLTVDELTPLLLHVCKAMEYSHSSGVLHLDIKPGNILVSISGKVKLCDFGIARMAQARRTTATARLVMGSVGFMSPEQYGGRRSVSERSDVYSLGATAYYALTGQTPVGVTEDEDVPRSLIRAMQSDPEDRFESVTDFRNAFINETGFGKTQSTTATIEAPDPNKMPRTAAGPDDVTLEYLPEQQKREQGPDSVLDQKVSRKTTFITISAALVVAAVVILVIWFWR